MARPLKLIDVKILPRLKLFESLLEEAIDEATQGPLHEAAKLVRDEARSLIVDAGPEVIERSEEVTPTGGRYVRVRRVKRRSLPGDPPLSQTGNLRESIQAIKNFVGTTRRAPYGRFLEFGTRKLAARPFLRPALERMRPVIAPLLKDMNLAQTRAGRQLNRKKVA